MRTLHRLFSYGSIGILGLAMGCSGTTGPEISAENAALGIAKFEVNDSQTLTTVVGRDAKGQEVARLDLTHGRFELSGNFRDDYDHLAVDGRRLHVEVGAQKLHWETEGYDPTLQMPAHPASNARLAAFLEDAHVKPVLDRWQIGFQTATANGGEIAYWTDSNITSGANVRRNLTGLTSSTTWASPTKTYGVCGGAGYAATSAWAVGNDNNGAQTVVAQCCPPQSGVLGGNTSWYGVKSCPHSGTTSQCGTASTVCKSCPSYPTTADLGCAASTAGSNPYVLQAAFTAGTYDVPGFSYGNTLHAYNQIPDTATEVDGSMDEGGWTFTDPYFQCYTQFTSGNGQQFTCVGSGGMNPYLGWAIIHAVHSDGRIKNLEFNTQPY